MVAAMSSPRKTGNPKKNNKNQHTPKSNSQRNSQLSLSHPSPSNHNEKKVSSSSSLSSAVESKIRAKLNKAVDLENRLSAATTAKNSESEASKLRIQLCEIFSDILLSDATFSARKDVGGRMWRSCFYGRINELRSRIAKEKSRRKKQQQQQPDNNNNAKSKLEECEGYLKVFIKDAVVLYEYLLNRYQEFILESEGHAILSQTQSSTVSNKQPHTLASGVIPTLHKLYIHLGDLHRYSSNYNAAETAYLNAALLAPAKGNPYNQLAVVAQLKDANAAGKLAHSLPAVALYWYCRSLLAQNDPFLTAKSNMDRLFQSNRSWITSQTACSTVVHGIDIDATPLSMTGLSREQIRPVKAAASRMFLSRFVDLHFDFFQPPSQLITNSTCQKSTKLLSLFNALLQESSFSDALLIKMVCINAFSLWNLCHSKNEKDPDATTVIESKKIIALTNMLSFGSSLATCLKNTIDRLDAKAAATTNNNNNNNSKNSNSSPTFIRLLGPYLLYLDFISYLWLDEEKKIAENIFSCAFHPSTSQSEETQLLSDAHKSFWRNVATLSNTFHQSTALTSSVFDGQQLFHAFDETKPLTISKELKFIRGFQPFASFSNYTNDDNDKDFTTHGKTITSSQNTLSNEMKQSTSKPSSVYISAEEAIQGLDLLRFSCQGTNNSASQSSSSSNNNHVKGSKGHNNNQNFKEDTTFKLFRFVRILKEHSSLRKTNVKKVCSGIFLSINETTWEVSCTFPQEDAELEEKSNQEESMVMNVDSPNLNEVEKREEAKNEMMDDDDDGGDDVVVYKTSESGKGPALLVPGALLLVNKPDESKANFSSTAVYEKPLPSKTVPFTKFDENPLITKNDSHQSEDDLLQLSLLLDKSSNNKSSTQISLPGSAIPASNMNPSGKVNDTEGDKSFMPQSLPPPKRQVVNPPPGFASPSTVSENAMNEKYFPPNEPCIRQMPNQLPSHLEMRAPSQQFETRFGKNNDENNFVHDVSSSLPQKIPPPGFNLVNVPTVSKNDLIQQYAAQSRNANQMKSSEKFSIHPIGSSLNAQPAAYQPHLAYNLQTANPFAASVSLGSINSNGNQSRRSFAYEATNSQEKEYNKGLPLSISDTNLASCFPVNQNGGNPEDIKFDYDFSFDSRDGLAGHGDFFGLKSLGIFPAGDNFFESQSDEKEERTLPIGNSLNVSSTRNPFISP